MPTETQPPLAELAAAARAAGRLGVDTEFMSERRYRPLLCLVQLAVAPEPEAPASVAVLDPLSGDDIEPLAELLAAPAIEIVVHAGWQDLAILRRTLGVQVANVFDTQVAAGFAGMSAQAGYDSLLGALLKVRLAKTASYTRWDRRPLTAEQLAYAREDVVHLPALAERLSRRLEEAGRLDWAREECVRLTEASDERDPDEVFRRLPRAGGMHPRERAVARELVHWREGEAAAQDRPVAQMLGDAALLEIARRRPKTRRELEEIRGVHPETLSRRGRVILEAVERGAAAPPVEVEERGRRPPDARQAPLVALAEALVRARALEAGIAYELIAARADLVRIVAAARDGGPDAEVRTLRGWRAEMVGDELLELLAGRAALAVDPDGSLRSEASGPGS